MIIIVRGLPGSGKTTFANWLVDNFGFVRCENDDARIGVDGVYCFDEQTKKHAINACYLKAKDAIDNGNDIVVSNVSARYNDFVKYLLLDKTDNRLVLQAIGRKDWISTHNVPPEVIMNMQKDWENIISGFYIDHNKEQEAISTIRFVAGLVIRRSPAAQRFCANKATENFMMIKI